MGKFAFECGIDRIYISLLESGKRQPALKTIFAIYEVINSALGPLVVQEMK
ncbi:MAG: helix-turn-helix transcriptional regulator [Deltaproteobacteria bacterium]|nr:helix-turn-helix transcriptional regulator [Deltaproteobacteria bacterium]